FLLSYRQAERGICFLVAVENTRFLTAEAGLTRLVSSRVNLRIGLSDFFRQQLIDEVLNGGIGLVVGGFDFSGRSGAAFGVVMEQAVSQGTADALVKQDESGGDSGCLFREAVGGVDADALQQAGTLHPA